MDGQIKTIIITAAITIVVIAGIAIGLWFGVIRPGQERRLLAFRTTVDELGERNKELERTNELLTISNEVTGELVTEITDGNRKQQTTARELQSGLGSSAERT